MSRRRRRRFVGMWLIKNSKSPVSKKKKEGGDDHHSTQQEAKKESGSIVIIGGRRINSSLARSCDVRHCLPFPRLFNPIKLVASPRLTSCCPALYARPWWQWSMVPVNIIRPQAKDFLVEQFQSSIAVHIPLTFFSLQIIVFILYIYMRFDHLNRIFFCLASFKKPTKKARAIQIPFGDVLKTVVKKSILHLLKKFYYARKLLKPPNYSIKLMECFEKVQLGPLRGII